MKYIVNEQNSCGQASLTEAQRKSVLGALGYEVKEEEQLQESVAPEVEQEAHEDTEMPTLYEWDDAVFALEEEVFEIDGNLFLRAIELDNETKSHINESHADLFINQVDFDEAEYDLGDIYDYGDDIYIRMDEAYKKGTKSKDKPEDKGDFETGERKGDKSNVKKDADDEGDFETGARKGDKSNVKKDADDKPDYTTDMRKGDKSKTHPGRKDFVKKKVVKEEEDPKARVQRQVKNLNLNTPRGRERATELQRRQRARELDKKKPITKPSQTVASDKDALAAAGAHGDK